MVAPGSEQIGVQSATRPSAAFEARPTHISVASVGVVRALARAVDLHPKVVRKSIRVAFLAPAITIAVVDASHARICCLGTLIKQSL